MAQFTLAFKLLGNGWAEAAVACEEQHLTMYVSFLSDSLRDLADRVIVLLRMPGLDAATCAWQEEPGEYRWVFRRSDSRVHIRILFFQESFSRKEDSHGEVRFEADCSLLRLATQVKGQLHQILNEFGEAGYQARFGRDFPTAEFRLLEELIRQQKRSLNREYSD